MQKVKEIVNKIKEYEQAIEELRVEYYKHVKPCNNTDCPFHSTFWEGHCSWTNFVTDCPKYKPKQKV